MLTEKGKENNRIITKREMFYFKKLSFVIIYNNNKTRKAGKC